MTDALDIFRNPPSQGSINDGNFDPELGRNIEIWLDGYLQGKVIEYDCVEGFVERYALQGFGEFVFDGLGAKTETIHGDVRVRWKQRP